MEYVYIAKNKLFCSAVYVYNFIVSDRACILKIVKFSLCAIIIFKLSERAFGIIVGVCRGLVFEV